jgi:iron complex outermembrane receptor protein
MKVRHNRLSLAIRSTLLLAMLPLAAQAQDAPAPAPATKTLESVTVTGTHIKQTEKVTQAPVAIYDRETIDDSGAASVGEFLQQITASGKALNAKFNSSGNFGYPPDGGGIGAGSSQVDLRNLESKRVLVLVDGIRWVNESSASGVSGSADLNTIPLAIVERIEVLEDGASAIYGSDAIAGVVNIITRKTFEGALVHAKYGEYGLGGDTKDVSFTIGHNTDKFHGVVALSYFEQDSISSGAWEQSSFPEPGAGLRAGSSGTPQGRFIFCDPRILVPGTPGFCDAAGNDWFDMTLNNGTTSPNYNGGNPTTGAGTYHNFSSADRFNFAPFNLLLTPQKRTSLFGAFSYDASDHLEVHAKVLFNERKSANQAAPEPIFVGPFAGTGGIADTVIVSALNPFNPFGIDLDPSSNFGFITKRPIELGPRIFTQDVKTFYFNGGVSGSFDVGDKPWDWDVNIVHSTNTARQEFLNGFNVARIKKALGDPADCVGASDGCVPLDLFGGEGRPITQAMLDYISTPQHDSSTQKLGILSANITGALWDIGDREVGFAAGAEHRHYQGDFNPDPLRQTGESQDSFAAPVSAAYDVNEAYVEFHIPWAASFSTDFAARYSYYSSFGDAVTGKAGFKWQPIEELVFRGTYSTGFRAPNLGELYGLTQFAPTVVDPCGSTGSPGPAGPQYVAGCLAQGAPPTFEQANTQIIAFTGGNPDLDPETSKNWNFGVVWAPSWAENLSWSDRLDFEIDYYSYRIKDAIRPPDIQALLNGCTDGSITGDACSGFSRQPTGNLNPPTAFLDNLGEIKTRGVDIKANWASQSGDWGQFTAALQATHPISYEADDSQREVGVEVDNSAIPDWQTNVQLGWNKADWTVSWNVRYISSLTEACSNAAVVAVEGCATRSDFHELDSQIYNDLQVTWDKSFGLDGLSLSAGVNNLFDQDPPICLTCTLNGYDAGTYDLPSRFWYVSLDFKF